MRDTIVDVTEKRYFITVNYLSDFLYPVVKLPADINRFPQPCRDIRFPDKQGFIILYFFAFFLLFSYTCLFKNGFFLE